MFISSGILHYSNNPLKLHLEVDNDIGKYYRNFIPKHLNVKRLLYPSHISIVRNEIPIHMYMWEKYQCQEIYFQYSHVIYNNSTYYWLEVFCPYLEVIRLELGLANTSEYTRSPDGVHDFHITVANTK